MHIILLTLLWMGGIWIGSLSNLSIDWWALPGFCLVAASIPLLFKPELRRTSLYIFYIAIFFLGGANWIWHQPVFDQTHISHFVDQNDVTLIGTVIDEPDIRERTINLTLDVEQVKLADGRVFDVEGEVLLRTPRFPVIEYGTDLTVKGKLETPFETAEFSYKDYLALQGIYGVMSFPRVLDSTPNQGNRLVSTLFQLKQSVLTAINQHVPAPESGLLSGILLGIDHSMPESIDADFRTVGITHIVVVSGFNIAIISSIFLSLFSPIFGRMGSVVATLIAILLFTLLVGADPSVVRAAIMGSIYVITKKLIGRRNAPIPVLFLAGFCMTVWNPNALWDIGFQLSFVATLSLMLYAEPISAKVLEWLKNRMPSKQARRVLNLLSDAVLVTIAAQILTLPLLLFYFKELSMISILANGLILPVQPLIMIWGGLMVLVSFLLPAVATLLGWVTWVFLTYTIRVAEWLALVPFASVDVSFSLAGLLVTYGLIFMLTWYLHQEVEERAKWIGWLTQNLGRRIAVGGSLVCFVIGMQWVTHRPDGNLHVHFFDVGQGDATLISTPSGRQILIDGGNFPIVMKQHLGQTLPLWDTELDLLVVTHPDADHVTGLPDLFDRYTFDQMLVSYTKEGSGETGPYAELLERAEATKAEIIRPIAGDEILFEDGVSLMIVHPGPELVGESRNDNSLSIRLSYGETSLLLTGDVEETGERVMLNSGLPLQADIFKAGHHGANNASSDSFLDVVQPKIGIVSAGEDNRFGHPHPEVLERFAQRGATVLRTDQLGSIEIISDGEQLWWDAKK